MALAVILCLGAGSARAAGERRLIDDFEKGLVAGWREKVFSGRTAYRVVAENGNRVLAAESRNAASGLVYAIEFEPSEWPVLAWRWKVAGVVEKGDARSRSGDDYPARVYVIFPHWFFPRTRTLTYIWANQIPAGTVLPSPFTDNAMMIAVESGPDRAGRWVEERRDIVADFRRAFGEDPPAAGAVAVMTDTDNTGANARAWYDDLRLERRRP